VSCTNSFLACSHVDPMIQLLGSHCPSLPLAPQTHCIESSKSSTRAGTSPPCSTTSPYPGCSCTVTPLLRLVSPPFLLSQLQLTITGTLHARSPTRPQNNQPIQWHHPWCLANCSATVAGAKVHHLPLRTAIHVQCVWVATDCRARRWWIRHIPTATTTTTAAVAYSDNRRHNLCSRRLGNLVHLVHLVHLVNPNSRLWVVILVH